MSRATAPVLALALLAAISAVIARPAGRSLAAPGPAAPAAAAPARAPGSVVRVEHRDPESTPSRGPASAPVTIELFFQPTTNAQARLPAYRAVERLQANHPTRVRVLYRIVKRGSQVVLPVLVLEAHAQGRFFDLMEELHRIRTTTQLSRSEVIELARRMGMDAARVSAAIDTDRYRDVLDGNERRHERLLRGISSMPAVLFNARPPRTQLSSMTSEAEWEREYTAAYERAMDLMDRGVAARDLMAVFDAQSLRAAGPGVVSTGSTDDEDDDGAELEQRLATPPLDLTGLPSYGRPGAPALPIVVLCRPNDSGCGRTVLNLRRLPETYAFDVRVVWAPWFDVARDDAAGLALLGDAALCAEQVGSSAELSASPGWRWVEKQLQLPPRSSSRRGPTDRWAERMIDDVTAQIDIDPQKLAACRARIAGQTLAWIEGARRAGVTRAPAVVVGGRIYEGLPETVVIQQLVEAELAPGVLGELAPRAAGARPRR